MHSEDAKIKFLTGVYELYDPGDRDIELDLGCGSGSYAAGLAKLYPQRHILAADVMIGRLRKISRRVERERLDNVTVLRVEARYLLGLALPDNSISRIHLLCPDPWPKGRHRGHRLLTSDFTTHLHRVLKKDGIFHFSSDDVPYLKAVETVIANSNLFKLLPDESLGPAGNLKTDFERRWLECGRMVEHRVWQRLELPQSTIGH